MGLASRELGRPPGNGDGGASRRDHRDRARIPPAASAGNRGYMVHCQPVCCLVPAPMPARSGSRRPVSCQHGVSSWRGDGDFPLAANPLARLSDPRAPAGSDEGRRVDNEWNRSGLCTPRLVRDECDQLLRSADRARSSERAADAEIRTFVRTFGVRPCSRFSNRLHTPTSD